MFYNQLLHTQIPKAYHLAVFFALLGSAHVKAACKMLIKLTPGLNFINVLLTAFTLVDPKSVKRYWQLDWVLMLWGTMGVKVVRKHIDEIDPSFLFTIAAHFFVGKVHRPSFGDGWLTLTKRFRKKIQFERISSIDIKISLCKKILRFGRQSGLVVSKLNSRSKGCGFESRLIQNTRWKWVKAMPGSIPAPNSGLL